MGSVRSLRSLRLSCGRKPGDVGSKTVLPVTWFCKELTGLDEGRAKCDL